MAWPKTSESGPLRIDAVTLEGTKSRIGLTLCPGGKQDGLAGPWDRNLDADLQAMRAFGAKALVSLMEARELESVNFAPEVLREQAAAMGLEWHHLPIRDLGIPNEHFEDLWVYSGLRLRRLLTQGQNVVIHCLGGLGRTGMIGARLLVELGLEPERAIDQVRAARPGSIETRHQEEHVLSCRTAAPLGTDPAYARRFLGCLLGGAVGDAFGFCVEFCRMPEIRSRFGPEGIKEPVFQEGRLVVSDDTQMTLFTLEGLVETLRDGTNFADSALQAIQCAYLDWYLTQRERTPSKSRGWLGQQPEMCVCRAPGSTCLSALAAGGVGTIEKPINNSKGCGGAMRVAPIGLFPRQLNPEAAFRLGAQAAALTHGHPSGYLSAGMVAAIVRFLVGGEPIARAVERCCTILARWQGHEETLEITKRALEMAWQPSPDHLANIGRLGEGWVGEEALAITLYAAMVGGTYVDVIRIAANHDGDSDSTASIAGQFWGAWKGLDGIPHEWVTRVDVLVPLLHLARQSLSQP